MAESQETGTEKAPIVPELRPAVPDDLRIALTAGINDFTTAPLFGLFFGGIFAIGGLIILGSLTVFDQSWMIIPLAIGFPLVGPFIAVGLYEVSRKLAAGRRPIWGEVLTVMFRQRDRQLGWMAFVVLFVFWIWIYQVRILLAVFLGFKSFSSFEAFVRIVISTPEGFGFLAIGTVVGAVIATILFSATVIAMPLLLDRDVDFISAMIASFKAVLAAPIVMLTWGIVVAVATLAAMIPAFLGLFVIMPILGHATWHLYSRIRVGVEPKTA